MALHRQQSQFSRAQWRLAVLVPSWTLQLSLMLATIGIFAYRLAWTLDQRDEDLKNGKIPTVELVWEVTGFAFPLVAAGLTTCEIIRYFAETLTPWTMFFTHVLKITLSCASLILDVIMFVQRADRKYTIAGVALDTMLIVVLLASTVYSFRTYLRVAAVDEYHHPANAKSYGYNDIEQQQLQQQQQNKFNQRLSIGSFSVNSLRRLSSSSAKTPIIITPVETDPEPVRMADVGRTPSYYNNERDTQFDEYIKERRLSSELSSRPPGNRSRSGSLGSDVGENGASLRDPRPAADSRERALSWGSAHVLVAVPEDEEDDGDMATGSNSGLRRDDDDDDDREALLGRSRSASAESGRPGKSYTDSRPSMDLEEVDLGDRKRKRNH